MNLKDVPIPEDLPLHLVAGYRFGYVKGRDDGYREGYRRAMAAFDEYRAAKTARAKQLR
jgi:hypothetical protein